MSDVGVAPPPVSSPVSSPVSTPVSTPTPAAPQRTEVPVNQNPTGSTNPVPSQAPELPEGEKRTDSRRESIQKAFARQRAENPPQPREAKKGDNNPPEDTPDEDFSLKKRPGDQPRERGRFVSKSAQDKATPDDHPQPDVGAQAGPQAARPGAQAVPQPYRPPPGAPAHHHPLPRMSPRAQADWDKVPDTVRADAHRLYGEVGRALQQYKADHDLANRIRPYIAMAREQGTTIDRVLQNHDQIEEKLRKDPIAAFEVITHNLNLHTPEGVKLTFRDLAWHALNQTPEQQQLIQQRNEAQAMRMQLQQMRAEQQALVNEYRRMQYAQHLHMQRGAVDQYADQRPRFDELGDLIHREIKLGFPLDEAYRRAELLRPATAAQTRQTTSAQTRTSDRSISGVPSGGPSGTNGTRGGKPVSRMEAIKRSLDHHRGSL